jgi:hypothetical protein
MPSEKSPLERIELDRVEGRLIEATASSFAEANALLQQWTMDAPKGGGYDKVDVKFFWENGHALRHRVDVEHFSSGKTIDLSSDIRNYIDAWQGTTMDSRLNDVQRQIILDRYRNQGLDKLALFLRNSCQITDEIHLVESHDSEGVLSRLAVADILAGQRESCNPSKIGYYESIEALVEKVIGSKTWSSGEIFVYAQSDDRFVVMKQIAPDSCEMMTVTNRGYQDTLTAYRYTKEILVQDLNEFMDSPVNSERDLASQES